MIIAAMIARGIGAATAIAETIDAAEPNGATTTGSMSAAKPGDAKDYGKEAVSTLVPAMLEAFLSSDRAFSRSRARSGK
ncbi:DUF2274 domain-containing protein [Novosphingobium sp. PhB57]|uniref:DUF2274 domain-containing protein n=1 Tax=Novosphingobium sp. PhB57 TaxID=2485107 RepID=UPI001FB42A01|nr:DUF2274 domain-containing protein [Novosphingobium sp. PhB57]